MAKSPPLSDTLPSPTVPPGRRPAEPRSSSHPNADDAFAATEDGIVRRDSNPATSGEHMPYQGWDRYQITSFLGAGGMGAVYKARDPRLKRSVAIKFLRSSQAEVFDTRQRRRFEREARAQASLEHPHICKIYEVGEVDGQPYIVMQLIHGSSMAGLPQVMTREEKVRAVQRVAEALHTAHQRNLIHRDIKPGNIMVERRSDGTFWPYLMDFGLVKEVDSNSQSSMGGVEGTPAFMAPEQARSESKSLDARTDVYGLGATLYAALAGRPPFVGNSTDVLVAVLLSDPPRLRTFDPAIPRALETIVEKCLEKDPRRRYASAQTLADDLGSYLEGSRISAQPLSLLRRAGRFAQRHRLLVTSVTAALLASLILGGVALRIRWQAAAQARLAQHLGQEITKMEWLLRSARQMPLHDLDREKVIIRKRMTELQTELTGYGEISRGLAYYALGRGHMALHEYPQALDALRQAKQLGVQGPEFDYALGFVLGKHFEQAMYEARLSGGGDWAKKQLKEIEPRYLTPAIEALSRSRSMKLDAPQYLQGLIAYYQRDYDGALKHADAALRAAPWLYEASKLSGDVHLERALQARDSGHNDDAEREFKRAIQSYEASSAIGQSDAEVIEGLAETWVRQLQTTVQRGLPADSAFRIAVETSEKLEQVEPHSIAGPLKKAYAFMLVMAEVGAGRSFEERVRHCLQATDAVLKKQPEHPYASELAASCNLLGADNARTRGEDPEPHLRRAQKLLEVTVKKYPYFVWGLNDLGGTYLSLGMHLQRHGNPSSKELFTKSLEAFDATAALDPTYGGALANWLGTAVYLFEDMSSDAEVSTLLTRADEIFARSNAVNNQAQNAFNNYFQLYTRAAKRSSLVGQDPRPRLKKALENLAVLRKVNGSFLDAEQHAALAQLIAAADHVRRREDPMGALVELQENLTRCFALAAQDAMCRTLAVQADWVRADWRVVQGNPIDATLEAALQKAKLATESPEIYPDAWQTLAETRLRLARVAVPPKLRAQHLAEGLVAVAKVFTINPHHVAGRATEKALRELL